MLRKRLRFSVVAAVLGLGMATGWLFGAPAAHDVPAGATSQVAATSGESGTRMVTQEGRRNHAFGMPYFSFKALVRPAPSRQEL